MEGFPVADATCSGARSKGLAKASGKKQPKATSVSRYGDADGRKTTKQASPGGMFHAEEPDEFLYRESTESTTVTFTHCAIRESSFRVLSSRQRQSTYRIKKRKRTTRVSAVPPSFGSPDDELRLVWFVRSDELGQSLDALNNGQGASRIRRRNVAHQSRHSMPDRDKSPCKQQSGSDRLSHTSTLISLHPRQLTPTAFQRDQHGSWRLGISDWRVEPLDSFFSFRLLHRANIDDMRDPEAAEKEAAQLDIRDKLGEYDHFVCRIFGDELIDEVANAYMSNPQQLVIRLTPCASSSSKARHALCHLDRRHRLQHGSMTESQALSLSHSASTFL